MDEFALLSLQLDWGADEALQDRPVNRLGQADLSRSDAILGGAARGQEPVRPAAPTAAPAMPAPFGTAAERALAAAGAARSLAELRAVITGFDGCALRNTATRPVLPQGDPASGLLLIGDPPGADEDRSGTPFAGEDGALLDSMLASIRLTRAELVMTPLIPWRPPGGRLPTPGELAVCLPFLQRMIALADPRHIVLLGPQASRLLLDGTRRRPGSGWVELRVPGLSQSVPALLLPTPQMMRATPSVRRDAWAELRRLRRALDERLAEL